MSGQTTLVKDKKARSTDELAFTPGVPFEIARGVYLLRMPLPFRLDHINLYILDDPAGWTLVDCGLNTPETISLWERLFASFLREKPVLRIVVTHLHPDHIGLAEWLRVKTGAPVYITPDEWCLARELFDLPVTGREQIYAHYERLGLASSELETMVKQAGKYRDMVKQLPASVNHLHHGETIDIGERRWQVLVGRGHSPQCACLWDEIDKILIAGDHVLPSISPNVNVLAVGPDDPLADYLASLREFENLPCGLLLPAHGGTDANFPERVRELIDHHEDRLKQLEIFCAQPRSANDCVPFLFKRALASHEMYFAIGEAAAHLVYLVGLGRLHKVGDQPWTFTVPRKDDQ